MDITRDITTDGPVLALHGDFDVRSTWEVRAAIYDLLEGHEVEVVVDLADVDNIDATALRVLAVATRNAWLDRAPPDRAQLRALRAPDDAPDPPGPGHRGRAGRRLRLSPRVGLLTSGPGDSPVTAGLH